MPHSKDRLMKSWFRLCPLTCLILAMCFLSAQARDTHPIEAKLNAALEKDLSTTDQLAAIAVATEEWNALLVKTLGQLQKELPAPAAAALKESQQRWEEFHKLEKSAITRLYENTEGTVFRSLEALDKLRLVKDRALQLNALLSAWQLRQQ